jgi:hypothetical protein
MDVAANRMGDIMLAVAIARLHSKDPSVTFSQEHELFISEALGSKFPAATTGIFSFDTYRLHMRRSCYDSAALSTGTPRRDVASLDACVQHRFESLGFKRHIGPSSLVHF